MNRCLYVKQDKRIIGQRQATYRHQARHRARHWARRRARRQGLRQVGCQKSSGSFQAVRFFLGSQKTITYQ